MIPERPTYALYGAGMAAGALLGAWFLHVVFERSFGGIALILLAMLMVILVRRMVEGSIPDPSPPGRHHTESDDTQIQDTPSIHDETEHLHGADFRYGWMILSPALAFCVVVASLLI